MIKQLKLITKDGNNLEMKNCPYSLGVEMIACSMSDEAIRASIKSLEHKLAMRAKPLPESPEKQV